MVIFHDLMSSLESSFFSAYKKAQFFVIADTLALDRQLNDGLSGRPRVPWGRFFVFGVKFGEERGGVQKFKNSALNQ